MPNFRVSFLPIRKDYLRINNMLASQIDLLIILDIN